MFMSESIRKWVPRAQDNTWNKNVNQHQHYHLSLQLLPRQGLIMMPTSAQLCDAPASDPKGWITGVHSDTQLFNKNLKDKLLFFSTINRKIKACFHLYKFGNFKTQGSKEWDYNPIPNHTLLLVDIDKGIEGRDRAKSPSREQAVLHIPHGAW